MGLKLVTIGVYGYNQEQFFQALQDAHVDVFCDVRARRGMRGSAYVFANSLRLQERLHALSIRYLHLKELAPSLALRQAQKQADQERHRAKRTRTLLDQDFAHTYEQECLSRLDAQHFLAQVGPEAHVVCLFCVERQPAACHRSILAVKLAQKLQVDVEHIVL